MRVMPFIIQAIAPKMASLSSVLDDIFCVIFLSWGWVNNIHIERFGLGILLIDWVVCIVLMCLFWTNLGF